MNDLVISHVNKCYHKKVHALNDVSLEIKSGICGLLGPNGAGKTTLIRILMTILRADSGEISMGNIHWSKSAQVRSMIGYVPQHFGLYPLVTVEEALHHIAILKGISKNDAVNQIEWALEKVNLSDQSAKKIKALSGGMLKRLAIAQAILGNPKLLVFDEPTAGLDPEERIRFRNIILDIAEAKTILISTHIVPDVQSVCQNAVILNNGKVLASDTVSNIINQSRGHIEERILSGAEYEGIKNNIVLISKNIIESGMFSVRYIVKEASDSLGVNPVSEILLEDAYMNVLSKRHMQSQVSGNAV